MGKRKSNQEIGKLGESLAEGFLKEKGFKILARNYRTPYGELDIVAEDENGLVFVEVKTRSNLVYGYGETAVESLKIEHLTSSADYFLETEQISSDTWRIDVISVFLKESEDHPEFAWFENVA
jgi:putative endonuclease